MSVLPSSLTDHRAVLFARLAVRKDCLIALALSGVVIAAVGSTRTNAWRSFTLSGEFRYLETSVVRDGFLSTYYEDMPSGLDKLRGWPRVDSFNQGGSFARLFLPYYPVRDNLVLDELCRSTQDGPEQADCLRRLWAVSIEGKPVSMADFLPAERAELGMRGLIGLVPLAGLEPGLREIEVTWSVSTTGGRTPLDDRYEKSSSRYVIPIAFSPSYEMPLP